MDPDSILRDLEDDSPLKRSEAIDRLRAFVRDHGGQLSLPRIDTLFEILKERLRDTNWNVALETTQFLSGACGKFGSDVDMYMNTLLPVIVENLGDSKVAIRKSSFEVMTRYASGSYHLENVVNALLRHGIVSSSKRTRAESCVACKKLIQPESNTALTAKCLDAVICRLEDRDRDVVEAAEDCLRHFESSRPDFSSLLKRLTESVTQIYEAHQSKASSPFLLHDESSSSSHSHSVARDGATQSGDALPLPSDIVRRRSEHAVLSGSDHEEFGFVPASLVHDLRDRSNWKVRAVAIERFLELAQMIRDTRRVVSHLRELTDFLRFLLDDPNFKICLTTLQAFAVLLNRFGTDLTPFLDSFFGKIVEKWGDNKIVVRQATTRVMNSIVKSFSPPMITEKLLEHIRHQNWRVREEVLNQVIRNLLMHPRAEYNFSHIVYEVLKVLNDVRPKVKFVGVEVMAVIHQMIGSRLDPLLTNLELTQPSTHQLLRERFSQKTLPRVGEDGTIEHQLLASSLAPVRYSPESPTRSDSLPSSFFTKVGSGEGEAAPRRVHSASHRPPGTAGKLPFNISKPRTKHRARTAPRKGDVLSHLERPTESQPSSSTSGGIDEKIPFPPTFFHPSSLSAHPRPVRGSRHMELPPSPSVFHVGRLPPTPVSFGDEDDSGGAVDSDDVSAPPEHLAYGKLRRGGAGSGSQPQRRRHPPPPPPQPQPAPASRPQRLSDDAASRGSFDSGKEERARTPGKIPLWLPGGSVEEVSPGVGIGARANGGSTSPPHARVRRNIITDFGPSVHDRQAGEDPRPHEPYAPIAIAVDEDRSEGYAHKDRRDGILSPTLGLLCTIDRLEKTQGHMNHMHPLPSQLMKIGARDMLTKTDEVKCPRRLNLSRNRLNLNSKRLHWKMSLG
eukprot:TRINITY_DN7997_c0_g1_i2.p1 TRINITY_DN7997_c0_g1~~TRINITY_DN7997_c0_g1_i2.p1  ORF type:complete len:900 (+),score=210.30 TRINITY_DN7997_c0_g1_i2:357-3056(+)